MAGATDTRIVQMQFDNKSFERDIKTSEKSLERFKEHLDFSKCEKSLEDFSNATKALSFESMANNLQKLADKFTGLGTISELVLSQVRRGIESTARQVSNLVNQLGFQQITAGRSKFEEMNKNVQTIIGATGEAESEVYRVMERLNKYTDQTSYNFTDMANNIGKFTAVGINLRDAEKQMEGIANWAARSGAGIQEASRAMYNLSQAMGVGKMTTIDWKSIENAGMATKEFKEQMIQAGLATKTLVIDDKGVIKTASNLGKQVEVTYQNLRETLSKGWANRAVMEKTLMGYYYDDLLYENKKVIELTKDQLDENKKLFEDNKLDAKEWGTLENMGAATDEVKQALIDIAVKEGNLVKETDKNGHAIYKTADKYKKKVTVTIDNLKDTLSVGWVDKSVAGQVGLIEGLGEAAYKAAQKCLTLTDVFNAWKDQLSTGWMRAWQTIFGNLSESMELFSAICNKVGDSFSEFIRILTGDGEDALGILGHWAAAGGRDSLWSLFVGEYDGMYEGAYGLLDVIKDIGDMISHAFWDMLYTLNADELQAKGVSPDDWFANEEYRTWFIGQEIKESIDNVKNFIQSIRDFFNAIPEGQTISRGQQIQNMINGIFSIATIVINSIRDIFDFFTELFGENYLGPSIDFLIDILEALGLTIRDTAENTTKGGGLKKFFDQLLLSIKPLTDSINTFIGTISGFIVDFIQKSKQNGTGTKIWEGLITVFTKLAEVVSKVAAPVLNFISSILSIVSDLFTNGLTKESLKNAGTALADAIGNLFGDIFGLFPEFSAKIEKFFSYIFGFVEEDASDQADGSGKTLLGVIKTWLRKIFGGTADFLGEFKGEMQNVSLFSIIKENLGIGLLGKFIGGLSAIVKGTNLYAIIMSFLGGYALIKLIKTLKSGKGMFSTITKFFSDLKNKSLKDIVKDKLGFSKTADTAAQKLQSIAKSIALIVGAVTVLCLMPLNRLAQGVIALGVIALIIVGLLFTISKVSKNMKHADRMAKVMSSIGKSILKITIGMALLITALKPLGNMRIDQVITMLVGFLGILTILALFAKYVESIKIKGAGSIALLALGIGILILALKPLATMDLMSIGQMMVGLVAILAILRAFSENVTSMKGSGMGSMVLLALSVSILILALKQIATMKPEEVFTMAVTLLSILAILSVFTQKVSFIKGSGMGSLIMVAITIFILVETLKPLANMSWESLGKMGAALLVLMFVLTKFTIGCESMKSTGMMQLVAVAAALWLVVQAVLPLAKCEWADLAKMAAGVAYLVVVVIALSHLVGPIGALNGAGLALMLVGLAAVIAAFAFAVGSIGKTPWSSLWTACMGLVSILVVFGLMMAVLTSIGPLAIVKMLPMFLMMVGLCAVLVAFSFALNEIKKVDTVKILAFAAGLSAILLVLAGSIIVLSAIPITAALKAIIIISLGLVAIMGVISLLAPMVIGSIGNALTNLSGQLALMGSLMQTFTEKMNNVDEGGIDKAENMLYRLKDLMGFLLSFVGFTADISGFTTILFDLGASLENFSWHMENTGDVSGNSVIELIKDLSGCAKDLDIITKMEIDTLTSKITGLGGAMMLYAEGARQVAQNNGLELDGENLPDVSAAVTLMQEISKGLSNEDGFIIPQNMPSEDDLGLFGAQLAALAGAIIKFEDAGKGLGEGARQALDIIDYFADLKAKLDETDFVTSYNEVTGTFTKEKVNTDTLSEFGKNIENLGSALETFSRHVTRVNKTTGEVEPLDFSGATNTLQQFVDLKNQLPDVGGVRQFFIGHKQTLTELGGELEAYGAALSDLCQKLTDFDPTILPLVETSTNQMSSLILMLQEKLPNIGGLEEILSTIWNGRDMNLKDLGDQMGGMGDGLKTFGLALKEGHWDENIGADSALLAIDSVVGIMLKLSELNALMQESGTFVYSLGNFLEDFGEPLSQFGVINASDADTISSLIVKFLSDVNTAFKDYGDIDPAKIEMFKTMAEAIQYLSEVNTDADWEKIGENIANGVKSGIIKGSSGVINAAAAMAISSYKAAKEALDIHSPSKKMTEIGEEEVNGIIQGVDNSSPELNEAVHNAVENSLNWDESDFDGEASISDILEKYNVTPKTGDQVISIIAENKTDDSTMNFITSLTSGALEETQQIKITADDSDITSLLKGVSDSIGQGDYEIPFSISPVYDQTNAKNIFGNGTEVAGAYNLDLSGTTELVNSTKVIDYTTYITSVKDEITAAREDLRTLAEAFKKTKYVFNSGAVVAAIGPEMDEYLGQLGYYSVRGDYD